MAGTRRWVTVWAASVQGPYPVGNPLAQPDLRFALPDPDAGAVDQTFRLIVRPGQWGPSFRLRLSNVFGLAPVTFDAVQAGLQASAAAVQAGSGMRVTFAGQPAVTIPPGAMLWSDPVAVPDAVLARAQGRNLAVSLSVAGASGPMTWHAKALTTSYITDRGTGCHAAREDEAPFANATTSWFFLDAVDMLMPQDAVAIVAIGDSLTEGTHSTLNGHDRWTDALARRLEAVAPGRFAVVNAGIGGNQVRGPATYSAAAPFRGGPSAIARVDRDALSLSGVGALVWMEGINDFSRNGGAGFAEVRDAMAAAVERIRRHWPSLTLIGGTVPSCLGSSNEHHGFPEEDETRRALNAWLVAGRIFDAVVDFDAAVTDPATGRMREAFVPDGLGGKGDGLHPNRAGYLAMANAFDLDRLVGLAPASPAGDIQS